MVHPGWIAVAAVLGLGVGLAAGFAAAITYTKDKKPRR